MSGSRKRCIKALHGEMFESSKGNREWAGAGSTLFSCGFCAHCQALVFLRGPGSCCGAAEHSQQPSFSTHAGLTALGLVKRKQSEAEGPMQCTLQLMEIFVDLSGSWIWSCAYLSVLELAAAPSGFFPPGSFLVPFFPFSFWSVLSFQWYKIKTAPSVSL